MILRSTLFFLIWISVANNFFISEGQALEKSQQNTDDVIYGEDNRIDAYHSPNPLFRRLAKSAAAMIDKTQMELANLGLFYQLVGNPLSERVCSHQRFAHQMAAANCSGFLIAPDLLMTAGHCLEEEEALDQYFWVFDYVQSDETAPDHSEQQISDNPSMPTELIAKNKYGNEHENQIPKVSPIHMQIERENVYSMKAIVAKSYHFKAKLDYAIVRLDRQVRGRLPLELRTIGKVPNDAQLLAIGHPSGLPLKIADGAVVRANNAEDYFVTNTDTFGGNSGSAIINAKTGIVEGILVRGELDYKPETQGHCDVVNHCQNDGCKGEEVTRIPAIKNIGKILQGTYLPPSNGKEEEESLDSL